MKVNTITIKRVTKTEFETEDGVVHQMPYKFEVVKVLELESAEDAFKLESRLKKINKKNKYIPKIKFNGSQECFSKVDLRYVD